MAEEEEKKEEEEAKEEPQEPKSLIEKAEFLAKELKEEREKGEKLKTELSILRSREILGGKSDAGTTREIPKEETPQEYMKRITGRK